jgi:hypothetical protein
VVPVTDVLIRNVDDDDLARIDRRAARLGLSRGEFLRRQISQEAARGRTSMSRDDLSRFAALSRDLLDEDVVRAAWS